MPITPKEAELVRKKTKWSPEPRDDESDFNAKPHLMLMCYGRTGDKKNVIKYLEDAPTKHPIAIKEIYLLEYHFYPEDAEIVRSYLDKVIWWGYVHKIDYLLKRFRWVVKKFVGWEIPNYRKPENAGGEKGLKDFPDNPAFSTTVFPFLIQPRRGVDQDFFIKLAPCKLCGGKMKRLRKKKFKCKTCNMIYLTELNEMVVKQQC